METTELFPLVWKNLEAHRVDHFLTASATKQSENIVKTVSFQIPPKLYETVFERYFARLWAQADLQASPFDDVFMGNQFWVQRSAQAEALVLLEISCCIESCL